MVKTSIEKKERAQGPLFRAENLLLADCLSSPSELYSHVSSHQDLPGQRTIFAALDEVGRGCVAGPVVVCASLWVAGFPQPSFRSWSAAIRDSKKMSEAQREKTFADGIGGGHFVSQPHWDEPPSAKESLPALKLAQQMRELSRPHRVSAFTAQQLNALLQNQTQASGTCEFILSGVFIGSVNATEIDRFGIVPSLGLAASRALEQIQQELMPSVLFFDGHRPLSLVPRWNTTPQILVTKGDDILKSISISSVIAKVVRDRWMVRYGLEYPRYDFASHRGYGTEKHQKALNEHGLTQLHRRSFLKNICPESPR
ncbi:MAG: hypothetical protein RLZZ488_1535 [Pseudomonadota bacterium]|jgi:ribonuclease HII